MQNIEMFCDETAIDRVAAFELLGLFYMIATSFLIQKIVDSFVRNVTTRNVIATTIFHIQH